MLKFKNLLPLAFFVLAIVVVSCSQEDLELSNPNELTEDTFFSRPEQLQSAVDAVYANLQTEALFTRVWYYMYDNLAHEIEINPQHEANKQVYYNYSYTSEDAYIFQYWDNCFRGINKANFVIQNEAKFQNVTQEQIDQSVGEAKFMRGFYYFIMANRFGGLPLYIEPTGEGQPRSTVDETYAAIIADFTDAASKLASKNNTDGGRPHKASAYGMLGKAYLFQKDYSKAKIAFEAVRTAGLSLTANYSDNFREENEFNSESVWEINYTLDFGSTTDWSGVGNGTGIHEFHFRGQDMGWNDWFNSYPAAELVDAYEDGDPRLNENFYFNGDMFNNNTQVVEIPLERPVAWKKYQQYYKQSNELQASGINIRYLRYADVLLMLAECENELNNRQAAIDLLNEVRDRVGMPNYGTSEMNAIYPVGNKGEVLEAIIHERQVELAGEQVRFDDMIRWDIDGTVLAGTGYNPSTHRRFPIPFREINTNAAISLTDQNSGF